MMEVSKEPKAREIGEKIEPDDYIIFKMLSCSQALVLDKTRKNVDYLPGYSWIQDISSSGIVTGRPYIGPPMRMDLFQACDFIKF